jgi:hypothetical protein
MTGSVQRPGHQRDGPPADRRGRRRIRLLHEDVARPGYDQRPGGVGDKAFTFVLGAGLNGLVALKGDKTIYLAAPASFDQEVALANVFFAS